MSNMEWIETTVGEYCPFIYGKALSQNSRENGDIAVYGSNGIVGFHNTPLVNSFGIIIGRKGTVGAVHLSQNPFWAIDTSFYVVKDNLDELKFTYYLLKTLGLSEMNSDSAVPGLNRENAHSLKIRIPKNQEDRVKIGKYLSIFDNKIQLNTQINQTLEQMAAAIFKSWFIDFDPVHAKADAIAQGADEQTANIAAMTAISGKTEEELTALSEEKYRELYELAEMFPNGLEVIDGLEVPMGWEVSTVGDIAQFVKGKKPKATFSNQDKNALPHILISSLSGIYTEFVEISKGIIISDLQDTLMVMDGAASGSCYIGHNGVIGSTLAKLQMKDSEFWAFLYQFLKFKESDIQANTTGTSIPHTDKARVMNYQMIIPSKDILVLFNDISNKFLENIILNRKASILLQDTRDLLLPKLLSGEVL